MYCQVKSTVCVIFPEGLDQLILLHYTLKIFAREVPNISDYFSDISESEQLVCINRSIR